MAAMISTTSWLNLQFSKIYLVSAGGRPGKLNEDDRDHNPYIPQTLMGLLIATIHPGMLY